MLTLVAPAARSLLGAGFALCACSVGACSKSVLDPPPPVASSEFALAPPGARGAHAAYQSSRPIQVEEAAPRAVPPEPEDPDEEPDDAGAPATPTKPDGVSL